MPSPDLAAHSPSCLTAYAFRAVATDGIPQTRTASSFIVRAIPRRRRSLCIPDLLVLWPALLHGRSEPTYSCRHYRAGYARKTLGGRRGAWNSWSTKWIPAERLQAGALSCLFRQTNIVWTLYAYALSQLMYLRFRRPAPGGPTPVKLLDPPAITAGPGMQIDHLSLRASFQPILPKGTYRGF